MIESVEVRNFQSLSEVALELKPLTVIVGPSSSGKSALTRALRTLTSNKRGNEFITHGERITTIKAVTDRGTVVLKRGKATDDNSYTVIPTDPNHPLYPQQVFTKLAGAVPEEVSDFLGIEAQNPLNYAGQFDKPYLLAEAGGEPARILGALTNVNVIFEAAAESNRQKLRSAATLKTRAGDLAAIREKVPLYKSLKGQLAALEIAEAALERARTLQQAITHITALVETERLAEGTMAQLQPYLDLTVPDPQPIIEAHQKLAEYKALMATIRVETTAVTQAGVNLELATTEETALKEEFDAALGSIASGIRAYFGEHSKTMEDHLPGTDAIDIDADEAADLAAQYIAATLKG